MNILKHKLIRNSSIYTGTNVLSTAIPFLLLPVLTRYLSPTDYGIVSTFQVIQAFAIVLVGLNLHGAVSVNYFKLDRESLKIFNGNVVLIVIISFLFIIATAWLFQSFLSNILEFPENWLSLTILSAFCQFFYTLALTLWQVEQKALPYGLFHLALSIVNVSLSLFFVVALGWQWQGRIIGIILTFACFGILGLFFVVKRGYVAFSLRKAYLKEALLFGVPLIPHALGAWITTAIGRIFINNMVSVAATGLYTVGYQVGMIIGILATSFNLAWNPFLYEKLTSGNDATKVKIVKLTYLYFAAILVLALLLSLIAPYLLKYFVGKEFYSSYIFVIWIALGYAFNGMYYMVGGYIFYLKKTYFLSIITLSVSLIHVALNYFLIKENGALGSAQATTVSFFLLFILTWALSARIYSMPWIWWRKRSDCEL